MKHFYMTVKPFLKFCAILLSWQTFEIYCYTVMVTLSFLILFWLFQVLVAEREMFVAICMIEQWSDLSRELRSA